MRFHSLVAAALVSSAPITACTAETDSSLLHRGSGASAAKAKGGGGPASPARSPEASTQQPAAGPGSGSGPATTSGPAAAAPATPATPLRTNVCENPTCTAGNGACGCTAVDTTGQTVQMDCQGGVCTCITGDQITTQVGDDGCTNDGDARTLYSASCGCL